MSATFYQCEGCLQPITALRDGKPPAHGWYERRTRHPCALVGTRNYTTYEGEETVRGESGDRYEA